MKSAIRDAYQQRQLDTVSLAFKTKRAAETFAHKARGRNTWRHSKNQTLSCPAGAVMTARVRRSHVADDDPYKWAVDIGCRKR